jgi:hypothetical protein
LILLARSIRLTTLLATLTATLLLLAGFLILAALLLAAALLLLAALAALIWIIHVKLSYGWLNPGSTSCAGTEFPLNAC